MISLFCTACDPAVHPWFPITTKLNKEFSHFRISEVLVNSLLYAMGKNAEVIFRLFTLAEALHANY